MGYKVTPVMPDQIKTRSRFPLDQLRPGLGFHIDNQKDFGPCRNAITSFNNRRRRAGAPDYWLVRTQTQKDGRLLVFIPTITEGVLVSA
jgi:hypothetical protein